MSSWSASISTLVIDTGLCITEHERRTGPRDAKGRMPQNPAFAAADTLGIPLEILDISDT